MSKKKIIFKPTTEVRQDINKIDEWVGNDSITAKSKMLPTKIETFRFTIDLPKPLHKRMKRVCTEEEISMKNKITNILLKEFPEN